MTRIAHRRASRLLGMLFILTLVLATAPFQQTAAQDNVTISYVAFSRRAGRTSRPRQDWSPFEAANPGIKVEVETAPSTSPKA